MVAPIVAAGGAKAAERAGKALTGDIYTRRWTSVTGKGKKKKAVEHELRVNPVGLGLAAVAGGVAAAGLGLTLWLTQRKIDRTQGHDIILIVDQIVTTYKTITITDAAAYTVPATYTTVSEEVYETIQIPILVNGVIIGYRDKTVYVGTIDKTVLASNEYVVPAVTHTEVVPDKVAYYLIKSQRGIPYKRLVTEFMPWDQALTQYQKSKGYKYVETVKQTAIDGGTRYWLKYHTDEKGTFALGQREGSLFNVDIM